MYISKRPSNIVQDFHQIFQYVQSQLLTRLALSCVHHPHLAYAFIRTNLIAISSLLDDQLKLDAHAHKSLTTSTVLQSRLSERRANHITPSSSHSQQSITYLRGLSLDVGAKYFAIAIELHRLDDVLQSESDLSSGELRNQTLAIERIARTLMECSEDFQRLVLSYHRLVHGKVGGEHQVTAVDATVTNEGTKKYKI